MSTKANAFLTIGKETSSVTFPSEDARELFIDAFVHGKPGSVITTAVVADNDGDDVLVPLFIARDHIISVAVQ